MLLTAVGCRSVNAPGIKRPLQNPSNRGKVAQISADVDTYTPAMAGCTA